MQNINTLIKARYVIPVEPLACVLQDHAIAINDGRIIDILPSAVASQRYQADNTLAFEEHALIPGLINTHTHASMSLFRGLADDLPLMEWLNKHIWPAESRWVNEEFIHDGTQLAIAEMLRGGTTCFNDMYFFPEITARLAADIGMRAVVGLIAIEFPTVYANDANEYISKGLEVHDSLKAETLITTAFAPHAPYTVSDSTLQDIAKYANELDIPIHTHLHETKDEITQGIEHNGKRPLARLAELGLISPALIGVHMTQLSDDEIGNLAAQGAHVVHCPESNLKLASGFCPVQKLLDAGINVALGTDSAASNNDLDMLAEMRTAALLAKAVANDATALPAASALRMATLNGAIALGLAEETGSLEVGKSADIVALHLGEVETQPLYNVHSHIVYAVGRDKVSDVWIAGQHLLKERRLVKMNEQTLKGKVNNWNHKIQTSSH